MTKALELLVERNDCLRLQCEKKGKQNFQYFREKHSIGTIPVKTFSTNGEIEKFVNKFRKGMVNVFKGETFKPVFANGPSGEKDVCNPLEKGILCLQVYNVLRIVEFVSCLCHYFFILAENSTSFS